MHMRALAFLACEDRKSRGEEERIREEKDSPLHSDHPLFIAS
jgi:hypothetical protein